MNQLLRLSIGTLLFICVGCNRPGAGRFEPGRSQPVSEAAPTVASEIGKLTNSDNGVRDKAFYFLQLQFRDRTPASEPERNRLLVLLNHQDPEVRWRAAWLLAGMSDSDQTAALPVVMETLKDNTHRFDMARILGLMGPEAKPAVPALIDAFKEESSFYVRRNIATALCRIDKEVGIPFFAEIVKDPQFTPGMAAFAIGILGSNCQETRKLIPRFVDGLNDPESRKLFGADFVVALCLLGPDAKEAIPILEACRVRWISCAGSGVIASPFTYIGPGPSPFPSPAADEVVVHVKALWADEQAAKRFLQAKVGGGNWSQDSDGDIRYACSSTSLVDAALKELGPADTAELQAALNDNREAVRIGAAFALVKADPKKSALAVSPLIKVIVESTNAYIRLQAAEALGNVGPDAKDAIPVLNSLLNDQNVSLRKTAFAALEKIK